MNIYLQILLTFDFEIIYIQAVKNSNNLYTLNYLNLIFESIPSYKFNFQKGNTFQLLLKIVHLMENISLFSCEKGASILGAAVSGATRGQSFGKDRSLTLLVIDDQNTDWSKYFRGRRLHGDYEIRVEQAEFRELSLTANEQGTTVSMAVFRNGTKVIRYVLFLLVSLA